MKKYKVDVTESLRYKENGRLKPAEQREYAKSTLKKLICPNCQFEKEISKISFGEKLRCPKCHNIMLEQY